jgi:hypothetical protein
MHEAAAAQYCGHVMNESRSSRYASNIETTTNPAMKVVANNFRSSLSGIRSFGLSSSRAGPRPNLRQSSAIPGRADDMAKP